MKKYILAILLCGFIGLQIAGCKCAAVRTSTLHKPRVDQDVSGNRGFISGEAKSAPKEPAFTERKVYQIEVELPQRGQREQREKEIKVAKSKDNVLWGNRGYIFGGPQEQSLPETRKTPIVEIKEKISQIWQPKETGEMRTYKARKGDTLQKISRKFYGTTKKWTLIYNANRDKLENPDKLYPGQVLTIPEIGEFKK